MKNASGIRTNAALAARTVLAVIVLAGLAACEDSPSQQPEQATIEALATTGAEEGADTATDDTARPDTAGRWVRTDTAARADGDTATSANGDTAGAGRTLPPAGDVTYETYRNDKFGYAVRYPSNVLRPADEVGNGNGRTFEAPDGSASMLVYATGGAVQEQLRRRYQEQLNNPDLNVTYQTRGEDWYVLSGYRGDHIFYERTDLDADGTLKTVRLFYNRARKSEFDPIVREVSFSM